MTDKAIKGHKPATPKCALQPRHSKQHFLSLLPGQYWGAYVSLKCSYCRLTVTALKSDILSASDRGPIRLKRGGEKPWREAAKGD